MRRLFVIVVLLMVMAMLGMLVWVSNQLGSLKRQQPTGGVVGSEQRAEPAVGTVESLLTGYGDSSIPPTEDLRKIQHVATGYFSVIKEAKRFPIGGNEDFAAALRGENANQQVFIPAGHSIFSPAGLLLDRWGSPIVVHPEGWRQLSLRSVGPDRLPYTPDDLTLTPTGISVAGQ
jgi:hypothetical protein